MDLKTLRVGVVILLAGFGSRALGNRQSSPSPSPEEDSRKTAWEILRSAASDNETPKRAKAVRVLGILHGDPDAESLALTALDDKEPEVRAAAADALGEMHSSAAIPKLREALDDHDVLAAWAASRALLALHDNHGYDIPFEVLTGKRKGGQSLPAQARATLNDPEKTLGFVLTQGIGFAPYGGYFLQAFRTVQGRGDIPAHAAAALALAHDPDRRAGDALVDVVFGKGPFLEKEALVRIAALRAIAERGDRALIGRIAPALSDHSDDVRFMAAAAVLRLNAIPPRSPAKKK
ncbi:MAG: HEAT repeat domain-containing protein [Candidatus Acidiferrales bacterium]